MSWFPKRRRHTAGGERKRKQESSINNEHLEATVPSPVSPSQIKHSSVSLTGDNYGARNPLDWDAMPHSLRIKFPHWKDQNVPSPTLKHVPKETVERNIPSPPLKKTGNIPENTIPYIVMACDTLASIALKFDTTTSDVARANNKLLDSSCLIYPGELLYIPDSSILNDSNIVNDKDNKSEDIKEEKECVEINHEEENGQGNSQEDKEDISYINEEVYDPEEVVEDTYIQFPSKFMSEQLCVHGTLFFNPQSLMFKPRADDPLVEDNGLGQYEVLIPFSEIVYSYITTNYSVPTSVTASINSPLPPPPPPNITAKALSSSSSCSLIHDPSIPSLSSVSELSTHDTNNHLVNNDIDNSINTQSQDTRDTDPSSKDTQAQDNDSNTRDPQPKDSDSNSRNSHSNDINLNTQSLDADSNTRDIQSLDSDLDTRLQDNNFNTKHTHVQPQDKDCFNKDTQPQEADLNTSDTQLDSDAITRDTQLDSDAITGDTQDKDLNTRLQDDSNTSYSQLQQDTDANSKDTRPQQDDDPNTGPQDDSNTNDTQTKHNNNTNTKDTQLIDDPSTSNTQPIDDPSTSNTQPIDDPSTSNTQPIDDPSTNNTQLQDDLNTQLPDNFNTKIERVRSDTLNSLFQEEEDHEKEFEQFGDEPTPLNSLWNFLYVRVSQSAQQNELSPVIGIEIPLPRNQSSHSIDVQHVRTWFIFAFPTARSQDLFAFLFKNHPSSNSDANVASLSDNPSQLVHGNKWEIINLKGQYSDDSLQVSEKHFASSWEIFSVGDFQPLRIECMDVENSLPLPQLIDTSDFLTTKHIRKLTLNLVSGAVGYDWCLVYSTTKHGISLQTLYRNMANFGDTPTILIVRDELGKLFGAMLSCSIKRSDRFYGTGESLLFSFDEYNDITVYPWTGCNDYIIKGSADNVAIGSGDGHFGLWLDEGFHHGSSLKCLTYDNEPLSSSEDFIINGVEVWGFM